MKLEKFFQTRVGDGGDGDGGRISPEHPSPILHAPRDIISRKGKSLTPYEVVFCKKTRSTQNQHFQWKMIFPKKHPEVSGSGRGVSPTYQDIYLNYFYSNLLKYNNFNWKSPKNNRLPNKRNGWSPNLLLLLGILQYIEHIIREIQTIHTQSVCPLIDKRMISYELAR